jgi:hypothetical protein
MAFTGTATIKQVSDRIVRLTGLSLAAGAAGTIGLFNSTVANLDVRLPEQFLTEHYAYLGSNVPFQDAISVDVNYAATGTLVSVPLAVVKSGTTVADFHVTVTNTAASAASANLEFYVKFHE